MFLNRQSVTMATTELTIATTPTRLHHAGTGPGEKTQPESTPKSSTSTVSETVVLTGQGKGLYSRSQETINM